MRKISGVKREGNALRDTERDSIYLRWKNNRLISMYQKPSWRNGPVMPIAVVIRVSRLLLIFLSIKFYYHLSNERSIVHLQDSHE